MPFLSQLALTRQGAQIAAGGAVVGGLTTAAVVIRHSKSSLGLLLLPDSLAIRHTLHVFLSLGTGKDLFSAKLCPVFDDFLPFLAF